MFKIGQRVICAEQDEYNLLQRNKIYTVKAVNEQGSVKVEEVYSDHKKSGYFIKQKFKKIESSYDTVNKHFINGAQWMYHLMSK